MSNDPGQLCSHHILRGSETLYSLHHIKSNIFGILFDLLCDSVASFSGERPFAHHTETTESCHEAHWNHCQSEAERLVPGDNLCFKKSKSIYNSESVYPVWIQGQFSSAVFDEYSNTRMESSLSSFVLEAPFDSFSTCTVKNTEYLQQAALEEYGPDLHVALRSRRDELLYLRKLTEMLFPYILPPKATDCR